MVKLSKRQKQIKELVEDKKKYDLKEAVSLLKKAPETKFDQTVEVTMQLRLEQTWIEYFPIGSLFSML